MTMSRRELFGWIRAAAPSEPAVAPVIDAPPPVEGPAAVAPTPDLAAFSLDTFYAARTVDRAIPAFEIRATTITPTTRVGGGRTEPATPHPQRAEVTAIAPDLVPEILAHRCLATSSFCSVCVERCPVPGAIVVEQGRPRVDPARCDGCGRCVAVCPAPILAFALVLCPATGTR